MPKEARELLLRTINKTLRIWADRAIDIISLSYAVGIWLT